MEPVCKGHFSLTKPQKCPGCLLLNFAGFLCCQPVRVARAPSRGLCTRAPRYAAGSIHARASLAGATAGYAYMASCLFRRLLAFSLDPFLVSCASSPRPFPPPARLTALWAHITGRTGSRTATGCAKWRTTWAGSGRWCPFPSTSLALWRTALALFRAL